MWETKHGEGVTRYKKGTLTIGSLSIAGNLKCARDGVCKTWAIIEFIYFVTREYLGKRRKQWKGIAFYIFFARQALWRGKHLNQSERAEFSCQNNLRWEFSRWNTTRWSIPSLSVPVFYKPGTRYPLLSRHLAIFCIDNTGEQSDRKTCFFGRPEYLHLFVDTMPHLIMYILCPLKDLLSNCQPASPPPPMEYKNNILCEPLFVNGFLHALLDMASAA